MFRFAVFCGILLLNIDWLPARELVPYNASFTHFTTEQGLPQNTPYALLEDREGFIWIGTEEGLARYDGNTFVIYQNDPQDTTSLGKNWVRDLAEDPQGNIWVGTVGGLYCFRKKLERFEDYSYLLGQTSLGFLIASDLLVDSARQRLFFKIRTHDQYKVGCLDLLTDSCRYLNLELAGKGGDWTAKSLIQKGEDVYLAVDGKLVKWQVDEEGYEFIELPKLPDGFYISNISDGKDAYLWLNSFGDGLWHLDTRDYSLLNVKTGSDLVDKGNITSVLADRYQPFTYWIGYGWRRAIQDAMEPRRGNSFISLSA
jgi:ligand-binding sensor domain-containing protein